jgi:ATPase subunit of ABC transporter with duplicated ATPase domains
MARQFIYHMEGLSKTYPGNRKVLENIHLSFYPDAKIGVLGVNGSGKSTLLRIMAGIDKEFTGEGWVSEGARVGYLQQEPQLDATKSVRENVMEGVAPQKAILDRYNELAMNYSDENAGRDDQAAGRDRVQGAVGSRLQGRPGDGRAALSAGRRRCGQAVRRRARAGSRSAGCCSSSPNCCCSTSPPTILDAESSLARRPSAQLSRRDPDRHPRPLLPRQRHRLDPRARSRPRHSLRGQLLGLASQKQKRLAQEGREEEARQRTLAREQEWIAASPRARQAKSKARYQRYEELVKQAAEKTTQTAQIIIPVTERLGQNVVDFEGLTKAFGDNLLIDDLTFKLPPGGIVGVIGPNGPARPRCSHDRRAGEADKGTIKIGESVHLGYVDQSRDALDGKKNVWEEISAARTSSCSASAR